MHLLLHALLYAVAAQAPVDTTDGGAAVDAGPPPPAGPAVQPSQLTGRFRVSDVEKMVRAEMDKREGVAEAPLPRVEEQDGLPTDRLGATLPVLPPYKVADLLADPALFVGERVMLTGLVRRTALDGSWMEISEVPSAPRSVRLLPQGDWRFFANDRPRRVTTFGLLKKRKVTAAQARRLDEQAGQKPRSGAGVELVLEAEGAVVQWLD
ncbi:MAG: hypothetical protein HY904_22600 [Deltaproteobacteria bacterium]|nr:hypothetical protein [Deltaproteobacteria bacterium]